MEYVNRLFVKWVITLILKLEIVRSVLKTAIVALITKTVRFVNLVLISL